MAEITYSKKSANLAGHRYISSTESYLQNDMEELIEEINQYHQLMIEKTVC
jgi:integrase/recombinase XerD